MSMPFWAERGVAEDSNFWDENVVLGFIVHIDKQSTTVECQTVYSIANS